LPACRHRYHGNRVPAIPRGGDRAGGSGDSPSATRILRITAGSWIAANSRRNVPALSEQLKRELHGCVERDDQGRLKLNVTLPDAGVLDKLAESLARAMSGSGLMVRTTS
jgi:hypothetical protein